MKAVLDTNVFISGIFWEGNFCSQIISKWRTGEFELVSSKEIIEELVKTLRNFKISMPEDKIQEWINLIIKNAMIVESSEKLEIVKEDPSDNRFLEAAIAGNADWIITQDNHLLKLKEYEGIKIIKPEEALKLAYGTKEEHIPSIVIGFISK